MTTTTLSSALSFETTNPGPKKTDTIIWWVIGVVVVSTACGVIWHKFFEEHFFVKRWAMVESGLYRSGEMTANMCEYTLAKHNIQVIISLGADSMTHPDKLAEIKASKKLGIDRTAIPMSGDGRGTLESYVEALTRLIQARRDNKTVLVHCGAGTQRTGGVIACYKMLTQKVQPQAALTDMKRYDFSPRGNPVLLPFLNEIMPQLTMQLALKGMIESVPNPIPVMPE